MKFKLVLGFPPTFTSEDRHCRSCWIPAKYMLVAEGTDYSFASCATYDCQQVVQSQILKAMIGTKVPA